MSNTKHNFSGNWTKQQNYSLMLSQIGHWVLCVTCALNNQKFNELPCMTGFVKIELIEPIWQKKV